MIKIVQLSAKALEYIRNELSQGGYLSRRLLKVDLDQGSVHTYVPLSFTPNSSTDYGESLNYLTGKFPLREIRDAVVQLISDYLGDNEQKYAIFETFQEKGDPSINKHERSYFFSHSRLYGFLKGNDEDKPIMKHLLFMRHYPTNIILANLPTSNFEPVQASELAKEEYAMIIKNVEYLIIGAWDGEGYLLWCKK